VVLSLVGTLVKLLVIALLALLKSASSESLVIGERCGTITIATTIAGAGAGADDSTITSTE
jgi:hypothetical protein